MSETSLYEPLAQLIEQHKATEAVHIYDQALKEGWISDAARQPEIKARIMHGLEETFHQMAEYVHTGDPTQWRDYLAELSSRLFRNNNQTLDTMTQLNHLFASSTRQLVEKEWTGPANERLRQRFLRRLDGIDTLAQTTIIATGLKKDLNR